jgi:acetyl-CoA synthetase
MFGIRPALVDTEGKRLPDEGEAEGNLVLLGSWPGQMRTVYGDHQRFIDTYFSTYEGMYFTGDGARRDADGYWWITGRVDDVLNVSGHRLGTAEIESALVAHDLVAEAAVVGYPHDIKGQGIYCFVTLVAGLEPTDQTEKDLKAHVRKEIGPVATPDVIQFAPGLPKTRSGKIMRRILRKSPRASSISWAMSQPWPTPAWSTILIAGRKRRIKPGASLTPAITPLSLWKYPYTDFCCRCEEGRVGDWRNSPKETFPCPSSPTPSALS